MDVIAIPQHFGDVAARLGLATLLGAAVGFNREWQAKPAGLRTHALVALGSALVILVSLLLSAPGKETDFGAPGRVLQGLLAGVGFIGGGVILHRERTGEVEGLTTAASIFIVAIVGAAVGAGLWRTALLAVGLAIFVLSIGGIDALVRRLRQNKRT
jgi:putative Mg2+ transporter-C (MgtC) family protein